MIPHYSPPFGPLRVVTALLSPRAAPRVEVLERAYAEAFGVRQAVILPAVRSGILMLLRALAGADTLVVGPAYTCLVVHEAMFLSGARLRFVEPAADGYLMSRDELCAAAQPGACLVLCEVYGLPYDENLLRATEETRPRLRVLDMAMGIPDPSRLARMLPNDVALFSFGFGKSLCAGGGGLACFRDAALAERVRGLRDAMIVETSSVARLLGDLSVLASVSIRTRLLCRTAGRIAEVRRRREAAGPRRHGQSEVARPQYFGPEWTHAMPPLERRLALHNLGRAEASARIRRQQAELYFHSLQGTGLLRGVGERSLPESHFPISVPAVLRAPLRRYLRRCGIDAGEEFIFSGALKSATYPIARRASEKVLTLPLGERVSLADVRRICGHLLDGFRRLELVR